MIGYLYRHIRLDKNEVFYVGVSKNISYKRAYSVFRRNKFWHNITSKSDYEVEIILESDDYDFLLEKEKEFIELYGRKDLGKGTLVNLTSGGDGVVGYKCTEEDRAKMSARMKLRPPMKGEEHPMFGKRGNLNPNFGIKHTEERKRKNSESQKGEKHHLFGKKRPPEYGAKMSLILKGRKYPNAWDGKRGENHPCYGRKASKETKHKMGRKVIDSDTGIIYGTILEASESLNLVYVTLKYWLYQSHFHKTSLRFYTEDN